MFGIGSNCLGFLLFLSSISLCNPDEVLRVDAENYGSPLEYVSEKFSENYYSVIKLLTTWAPVLDFLFLFAIYFS